MSNIAAPLPRQGLAWPSARAHNLHQNYRAAPLTQRAQAAEAAGNRWQAAALRGAAQAATGGDAALKVIFGHGITAGPAAANRVAQTQLQQQQDPWAFGVVGWVGHKATDGVAAAASAVALHWGSAAPERLRRNIQSVGYGATALAAQVSAWAGLLPRAILLAGGALAGVVRTLAGPAPQPQVYKQEWPATAAQRSAIAESLHKDLTTGNTAAAHPSGACAQFANDAVRSSLFLVQADATWETAPDIRPATPEALPGTLQQLTEFCDANPAWAFRVSQYANQNPANTAWAAGLIGGQGIDGRSYKDRRIERCRSAQHDAVSPQHDRLELQRVGANTVRLRWHRMRDLEAVTLQGKSRPESITQAGYSVTLAVDIDRPQAGETTPVRLQDAILRTRMPRPLDA